MIPPPPANQKKHTTHTSFLSLTRVLLYYCQLTSRRKCGEGKRRAAVKIATAIGYILLTPPGIQWLIRLLSDGTLWWACGLGWKLLTIILRIMVIMAIWYLTRFYRCFCWQRRWWITIHGPQQRRSRFRFHRTRRHSQLSQCCLVGIFNQ